MHTSHGYPRPSMLSNRKTAVIEDAIGDFPDSVESIEDIQSVMQGIAETAREVGQEYGESADNMPESLQQGYQAEAMREVADELETWADEIESWESENEEPTEDDARNELDEEEQEDADAVSTKLDEMRSEWLDSELQNAQDKLSDLPEYQG